MLTVRRILHKIRRPDANQRMGLDQCNTDAPEIEAAGSGSVLLVIGNRAEARKIRLRREESQADGNCYNGDASQQRLALLQQPEDDKTDYKGNRCAARLALQEYVKISQYRTDN